MNLNPFRRAVEEERSAPALSFDDYLQIYNQFNYNGVTYTYGSSPQEEIGSGFASAARSAYKSSAVVFACMAARARVFSGARFQFQQIRNGQPGDMFGTPELERIEKPWPGGTTGDLLTKALQYADLGGNAYFVAQGAGLFPLRPDWTTIVAGSVTDEDASLWNPSVELLGYRYQPGGPGSGHDPIFYLAEEVAHFAPIPDPESRFLGMSWLTPVVREIMADKAATDHKLKFFENGATPNMVVKLDVQDLDKFTKWIQQFKEDHEGAQNAYRTVYLGAGADVTVVGADLKQLDFKVTQGAGETRIAAAAGVPPIIVGLSEGLEAATYSNYGQARRAFADTTIWDLWQNFAGSIAKIINVPSNAILAADVRNHPFLREDSKDVAEIKVQQSLSIKQLVEAGFTPDSAVVAVTSDDLSRLEHSGLVSVQLMPPGTQKPAPRDPSPAPSKPARDDEHRALDPAPTTSVNFNEGAFQLTLPENKIEIAVPERSVTVEPATVNVTVEPPPPSETRVEIAEGAFRVDAPPPADVNVTVEAQEAPKVEFAEGSIRVEAAPTPDVNVTVEASEAPRVEFAEGSIRVDAPPPAEVNVTMPDIHATLELDAEKLRADAPVINVNPTPVTVENTVNVPETPVTINVENEPLDAEIKFKRKNGQIESAKLTETDSGD